MNPTPTSVELPSATTPPLEPPTRDEWSAAIPLAELKRLLERHGADPAFRERLSEDPLAAARELGFAWHPDEIRRLWDVEYNKTHADEPLTPVVQAYVDHVRAKLRWRDEMRNRTAAHHPTYEIWRNRQKARLLLELGHARSENIVHAPMCFELNKGCSVGCWFCGISAPKMTDVFHYNEENRALWRDVLGAMRDIVGPLSRWGFCYWATDPMDNPDYERFCLDYHDILGMFPQTTTALALRDPRRTRALLKLSAEKGCLLNRFSILTLEKYRQVHREFTADELLGVECIAQNHESVMVIARAGKAMQNAERVTRATVTSTPSTIACVSGFLFNMVDRSVKLITPCAASDAWPLGYQVRGEFSFSDGPDVQRKTLALLDTLPTSVQGLPTLRFARFLEYAEHDEGFTLSTPLTSMNVHQEGMGKYLHALGRLIGEGRHTADQIAMLCLYTQGATTEQSIAQLARLFEAGALDEDPSPPPAPAENTLP